MTRNIQGRRGFTLMELLTVMVIMSIVLATGVVSYVGARRGAELRGATSSVQSAIAMARQHAVTKRRTTAIVFRLEGTTNCYYVFEKVGVAAAGSAGATLAMNPMPLGAIDGNFVCNMSSPVNAGQIGTISRIAGNSLALQTAPATFAWNPGDSVGFLVNEKMFIPPGVECKVDDVFPGLILFYANGKAFGVGERKIKLTDKMSGGAVTRNLVIYPLVGLVKSD
jgi:prepilin-type N-terminal cleavage/methylation domain-containing protein